MTAPQARVVEGASTVLIVERDAEFAGELAGAFERAGFAVRRAADEAAALEEITWQRPHLIVLHLDLPAMPAVGGARLLEVLRRQPITHGVPMLALATLRYGEALRAGADDCLLRRWGVIHRYTDG